MVAPANDSTEPENETETLSVHSIDDSGKIIPNLELEKKKSKFAPQKKRFQRRLSARDFDDELEDIDNIVDKSLNATKQKEYFSRNKAIISRIQEPIEEEEDSGNNITRKLEKKVTNEYISATMKGYYSDSAVNERHKVKIEK